ncbi:MAG TPA: MIP family channel protein [Actinomycetota bacterium]|nr:MIP family channel protein [Actinomycetota bacterium]
MEKSMGQRLVAEFVGTLTLVFIGAGAVLAASIGLPGAGLVTYALATGLAIAVMVSALGHVSGGHFNPAVTIGIWIAQKIKSSDAIAYVVAQLAGATAGAALLRFALPETLWRAGALGTPQVTTGVTNGQAVLIEAILAFFLVWVVFGSAVDAEGSFGKIAGLGIGLVYTMDIMMAGPLTGGALNPARHVGPALMSGTWKGWWVYWIGPVAGGIVAAALYDGVILRKKEVGLAPDEAPHGFGAHGDEELPPLADPPLADPPVGE